MNIDIELYKLIRKYDIYHLIPEVEELYKESYCAYLIDKLVETAERDEKIALRGGGLATQKFLAALSDENKDKIKYIIDSDLNKCFDGCITIHPSELEKYDIDSIIVPSYKFRRLFLNELLDGPHHYKVVDLYDFLASEGMVCRSEFFSHERCVGIHKTYFDINNTIKLYEQSEGEEKKYWLQKLIAEAVEIRDFINAENWICEYLQYGYDEKNVYKDFLNEIKNLFEKIKTVLENKVEKDIIIQWIDNINAQEFSRTKFGKERMKDSTFLVNAYTHTPWTRFTHLSLFLGQRPIEEKTYKVNEICEQNSIFLKICKQYSYKFKYIANPGMFQELFEPKYVADYPEDVFECDFLKRTFSECSTKLYWTSLKERVMEKGAVCHLIHSLAETHAPYIYTNISEMYTDERLYLNRLSYRENGLSFVLNEIQWYKDNLNVNGINIYLSDHGESVIYKKAYSKERTNVIFVIEGAPIPIGIEERLYSHLDFHKVLDVLMSKKYQEWSKIFSPYVIYENPDFYDKRVIEMHIMRWLEDEGKSVDMANFQLRGVRTGEDLYVIYSTGKEMYYRLPNENDNQIHDVKWKNRIEELRKLCPPVFIDIKKEREFQYSYLLYKYLSNVSDEKIEW